MADINSSFAVTLPNAMPGLGEVLQQGMMMRERSQERKDAQAERDKLFNERTREYDQRNQIAKQEKDRSNRQFNLKQIQDATAQKQFDTPNQKINTAITSELKNIYDQAIQQVGESPEFVSQMIRDKIQNATQWHDMATQDSKRIEKQQLEFNRTLPNSDLNGVTGIVTKGFESNYFNQDANGNFSGLKQPNLIKQDVNYFEPFNNGNILASVTNDTSPVYEFFKGVPKQQIHGSDYVSKRGNVVSKKWSGWGTPYTQVVGDKNDKPTVQIPYESAMVTDNGEPIKIATQQLKAAMEAKPSVEASFGKLWQDEVKKRGLQNVDSHALDVLKENFRYRFAEEQLMPTHQVSLDAKETTPITNNINSSSKSDFVTRVSKIAGNGQKALSKEDAQNIVDILGELYVGGGQKGMEKAQINKDDTFEFKLLNKVDGQWDRDNPETVKLDPKDPNFYNLLAGVYKQVTGADAALDKSIFSGSAKFNQAPIKEKNAVVAKGNEQQKMNPTKWNDSWNKLKTGQTMVGLDGKTYTKK